jgi:hypothetical protein
VIERAKYDQPHRDPIGWSIMTDSFEACSCHSEQLGSVPRMRIEKSPKRAHGSRRIDESISPNVFALGSVTEYVDLRPVTAVCPRCLLFQRKARLRSCRATSAIADVTWLQLRILGCFESGLPSTEKSEIWAQYLIEWEFWSLLLLVEKLNVQNGSRGVAVPPAETTRLFGR